MKRALAVVVTDTGVGKTVVTAALLVALRRRGLAAVPWKPWGSGGVRHGMGWISPDAVWWKRVLGLPHPLAVLNPVCHRLPLAPAVAARLTGRAGAAVPRPALRAAWAGLGLERTPALVEGVGGVLVPVDGNRTVADFLRAFRLPALVVAHAGLGTLNHTLLTLEALARRRITVIGVLLNGGRPGDPAVRSNPGALRRLARVPVWGPVPRLRGVRGRAGLARLAARLPGSLVRCVERRLR